MCSDIDHISSGTEVKMAENIKLCVGVIVTLFILLPYLMLTGCLIFRKVDHPIVFPVASTLGYIYEDALSMLSIGSRMSSSNGT